MRAADGSTKVRTRLLKGGAEDGGASLDGGADEGGGLLALDGGGLLGGGVEAGAVDDGGGLLPLEGGGLLGGTAAGAGDDGGGLAFDGGEALAGEGSEAGAAPGCADRNVRSAARMTSRVERPKVPGGSRYPRFWSRCTRDGGDGIEPPDRASEGRPVASKPNLNARRAR